MVTVKKHGKAPERRKFSRKAIGEKVEIKAPRWENWEKVPLFNIGRGGMGFFSRLPLDLGDPVHVRVRFGHGHGLKGAEVVSGKVAWVRPHAFFQIGVVFETLDLQRHRRLLEVTPSVSSGAQPQQTDRLIWKGWIRSLLDVGALQTRDLQDLVSKAGKS
jgi:hypothetical protein